MGRKATHKGTCQCCGAVQKLPNGVLSKHGYTVDFGYFNGTCRGAGHAPFEESKDLIARLIAEVSEEAASVEAEIEATKASTDSKSVWYQGYRRSSWSKRGGYFWEKREVTFFERHLSETDEYKYYAFVPTAEDIEDDKSVVDCPKSAGQYQYPKTMDEAVKIANQNYVDSVLSPRLRQLNQYVEWQKERVENWKPADLIEL